MTELEFYKNKIKILTDVINVSEQVGITSLTIVSIKDTILEKYDGKEE